MIKLNGHEIKPTMFPDGTSQVWKIDENIFKLRHPLEQAITWEFENEAEFIHIAQLCDLIEAKGFMVDDLHIPYLPYGRQDKEISNNTTFAKKTFVKLLETLPAIKGITTVDGHSDIYGNVVSELPYREIRTAVINCKPTLICFPDKGAKDRYQHMHYVKEYPTCSMSKERDISTGYITKLFLNELLDIKGESVLIIDDICDGGMTFKLTAEKLLTLGAKEVNLYTTHGIYSKGIETLKESGINRIFNRKGEVE